MAGKQNSKQTYSGRVSGTYGIAGEEESLSMDKKYFNTTKTARYFILGNPGKDIRRIWVVLHGYGQLAEHFLQKFNVLKNDQTLIIAPEGMHRYYLNGVSGKVGASWMTKEERENDITDNVHYLDGLLQEIKSGCSNADVVVLGFSQGVATAARWVAYGKVNPVKVIFWGGLFPPDMNWEVASGIWKTQNVHILIGNEDEFYTSKDFKAYYAPVLTRFGKVEIHEYEGKHAIYENVLNELAIIE
ncbi:MAG: alpha/beta hydrolase [Flavobacteriales bacterium]